MNEWMNGWMQGIYKETFTVTKLIRIFNTLKYFSNVNLKSDILKEKCIFTFWKNIKKNSFTLMTFLSNYIDIMTAYKCQMKFKLFWMIYATVKMKMSRII